MSPKPTGPITQAWYQWKALRLPWRKRFLVGFDLEGNTFWEFRLTRGEASGERWRRIVKYPRSTHLSQVKVSPQWHQWLRYTRDDPPTVHEQQSDVVRQAKMRQLAAAADARWEAKPRVMDIPGGATGQPVPALDTGGVKDEMKREKQKIESDLLDKNDPWAKARAQGPGESWQPTAWSPPPAKKR